MHKGLLRLKDLIEQTRSNHFLTKKSFIKNDIYKKIELEFGDIYQKYSIAKSNLWQTYSSFRFRKPFSKLSSEQKILVQNDSSEFIFNLFQILKSNEKENLTDIYNLEFFETLFGETDHFMKVLYLVSFIEFSNKNDFEKFNYVVENFIDYIYDRKMAHYSFSVSPVFTHNWLKKIRKVYFGNEGQKEFMLSKVYHEKIYTLIFLNMDHDNEELLYNQIRYVLSKGYFNSENSAWFVFRLNISRILLGKWPELFKFMENRDFDNEPNWKPLWTALLYYYIGDNKLSRKRYLDIFEDRRNSLLDRFIAIQALRILPNDEISEKKIIGNNMMIICAKPKKYKKVSMH